MVTYCWVTMDMNVTNRCLDTDTWRLSVIWDDPTVLNVRAIHMIRYTTTSEYEACVYFLDSLQMAVRLSLYHPGIFLVVISVID
jgi:hypothetical protein